MAREVAAGRLKREENEAEKVGLVRRPPRMVARAGRFDAEYHRNPRVRCLQGPPRHAKLYQPFVVAHLPAANQGHG